MSHKTKRLLLLSFLLVLFTLVPVSAQPGSESDPLVSKKYVDDQIALLQRMISQNSQSAPDGGYQGGAYYDNSYLSPELRGELLAEALEGFENVYGDTLRQAAGNAAADSSAPVAEENYPPQFPSASAAQFEVVFAESGSVIFFESSAELILRGGSAVVVTATDGVCDVTSGADLTNGADVPYNHLLIVPSGDGRGIQVYNDAYLMIKGGYYFG